MLNWCDMLISMCFFFFFFTLVDPHLLSSLGQLAIVTGRTPQSLVAGLMWIGVKDGRYFMRHVCQDSDELSTYGWTHHNGRDYGHQVLIDHGMTLATSFLKSKEDGSGYGGDWTVRIDVKSEK